eukprot:1157226-Pelagomonas_calceolata.AAC.9
MKGVHPTLAFIPFVEQKMPIPAKGQANGAAGRLGQRLPALAGALDCHARSARHRARAAAIPAASP